MALFNPPRIQTNLYLCPTCEGDGKFYTDAPDDYEGHKLSRSMPCPMCHGAKNFEPGSMLGEAVVAYWTTLNKLKEEEYNKVKAKQAHEEELYNTAIEKLTPRELEILEQRLKHK